MFASSVAYINRGVELSQSRLIERAIRQNTVIRHTVTKSNLELVVSTYVPVDCKSYSVMNDCIAKLPDVVSSSDTDANADVAMDTDDTTENATENANMDTSVSKTVKVPKSILPEVEVYIFTLIICAMLRCEQLSTDTAYAATLLIERIKLINSEKD